MSLYLNLTKSLLSLSIIICFLSFQGCDKNPATPETGIIQGRVMNTAGDALIVGASVSTNPPTSAVSTDTQGKYIINGVLPGQYTVAASKDGYNPGSVAVSVAAGQTTTADIYLGINSTISSAPTIITQPQSQTVTVGQSVTFSVTASGTGQLSYQWKKDGVDISGATTNSYSISNAQNSNAGIYTVTASNSAGNVTSNGAVLTVSAAPVPPTITSQPQSWEVAAGHSVTFSVVATGTAPLSYQWYKNGTAISGATSSSYSLSNVQITDTGTYTVTVSNGTLPNATSYGILQIVNSVQDSVTDIDGNVYHTVTIGTQVWMVENLKTTRYNDGTAIPLVPDNAAWAALTTPGYCWYNNDAATYKSTYGALYNWHTVNTGKLVPTGWHVPTDSEWSVLTTYLGGESVAGGKLKEDGTTHWASPNTGATNTTGYSAFPGGYRNFNGSFSSIGNFGGWWSASAYDATYSWSRFMSDSYAVVSRSYYFSTFGFSVRCVKN
jgi:uncharacterized protein (TIGR02145 family)